MTEQVKMSKWIMAGTLLLTQKSRP